MLLLVLGWVNFPILLGVLLLLLLLPDPLSLLTNTGRRRHDLRYSLSLLWSRRWSAPVLIVFLAIVSFWLIAGNYAGCVENPLCLQEAYRTEPFPFLASGEGRWYPFLSSTLRERCAESLNVLPRSMIGPTAEGLLIISWVACGLSLIGFALIVQSELATVYRYEILASRLKEDQAKLPTLSSCKLYLAAGFALIQSVTLVVVICCFWMAWWKIGTSWVLIEPWSWALSIAPRVDIPVVILLITGLFGHYSPSLLVLWSGHRRRRRWRKLDRNNRVEHQLLEMVQTDVADLGLTGLIEFQISDRASGAVAYSEPCSLLSRRSRIVLGELLLDETVVSRNALRAIILHELGHIVNDMSTVRRLALLSVVVGLGRGFLALGIETSEMEQRADEFACSHLKSVDPLIEALYSLGPALYSQGRPDGGYPTSGSGRAWWLSAWSSILKVNYEPYLLLPSYPTLQERIEAITARKLFLSTEER